jgi:riboflavin kinase/FMN adenylyltransferase
MQIVRGSASMDRVQGPFAVGIGNFDGVHQGHQALFRKVLALAEHASVRSLAFTFDPHPARVLNPPVAPKLIEPLYTRVERLAALGLDAVLVEPFTPELASMSAETFASDVLAERIGARHVVVGADFTFGRGRAGNVEKLALWGQELGFGVHPLDILQLDGITVSSTKIREYIWAGAVRGAALLLGHPFSITGLVLRGSARGSKLGFGTANVTTNNELIPAVGVYAARASGTFGNFDAVVNVGHAPTFGGNELRIEAHLPDYSGGSLYGYALELEFIERLRDEIRFADAEALKVQIARDIVEARRVLANPAGAF